MTQQIPDYYLMAPPMGDPILKTVRQVMPHINHYNVILPQPSEVGGEDNARLELAMRIAGRSIETAVFYQDVVLRGKRTDTPKIVVIALVEVVGRQRTIKGAVTVDGKAGRSVEELGPSFAVRE